MSFPTTALPSNLFNVSSFECIKNIVQAYASAVLVFCFWMYVCESFTL